MKNSDPLAQTAKAAVAALRAAGHEPLPPGPPSALGDLILGGGTFVDLKDGKTPRHVLSRIDLATRRIGLAATAFLPHGVALDPLDPSRIILFEKIGPGCCELDLNTGERTREVAPAEGRWFYGHGAFSPDGKLLYSTETVNSRESGVIGIRDGRTLEYLGEFPTHGENPHDCHLVDGGRVMVVANGGGTADSGMQPCVTYVDVESRKLLEKVEIAGTRFNAGHLALSSTGELVVVSAPRKGLPVSELGAVSLRRGHDPLRTAAEPAEIAARMTGESLSVEMHEASRIAACTHSLGTMVTFWSLDTLGFLKALDLPRARGLALTKDGRHFLVSYNPSTELVMVDPATLEVVPGSQMSQTFASGSHLVNWTRAARPPAS